MIKYTIYPTRYVPQAAKLDLGYIESEGYHMNAKEAVAKRIVELCEQHKIAINTLGINAGVSPSTIYSMLNNKSQNPGVVSIKKICDGLDISLREFFDSPLFDNLEQEIK
jgi:DNA-binding Xre family transcriptional regulator